MEFGFQTPQKNLKYHSAAPREISNLSVVFEPNSKFHSPQKRVYTKTLFVQVRLDNDLRELSFYSVCEGDTLLVRWSAATETDL